MSSSDSWTVVLDFVNYQEATSLSLSKFNLFFSPITPTCFPSALTDGPPEKKIRSIFVEIHTGENFDRNPSRQIKKNSRIV